MIVTYSCSDYYRCPFHHFKRLLRSSPKEFKKALVSTIV